ncbi:Uncharacterized protein BCZB5J_02546 [Bacillus cereus]|uniref:hypothetical protein n=1 Tax=Bacillus TaxID=1386 RepID=UPI000817734D|nr:MULTISPECIES: hypothetical protein [unclassified Bacillus (in: firmicutes)]MDA2014211.1 hypothetical protein [Bacillus cereus]WMS84379.1 hypothetical protein RE438_11930 [Bacillus wiedmannii]SCC31898.1 Uncharacterized protein BCZB5J_02546 [Bacillus cereus]
MKKFLITTLCALALSVGVIGAGADQTKDLGKEKLDVHTEKVQLMKVDPGGM